MTIILNKDICHDLSKSVEKEWLETNGIGGYASSTIIGANTRRYHGLLMAATRPPLGRTLLLSKLEEFLCIEGKEFPLSTNLYPHAIYPEGYKNLVQFGLTPFPTFDYSINGIRVKKTVIMVHGENTTVILYQVKHEGKQLTQAEACGYQKYHSERSEESNLTFRKFKEIPNQVRNDKNTRCHAEHGSESNLILKIRVMVAFRDYHWLTHENPVFKTDYKILDNKGICLQPYDTLPSMYLFHNAQSMDTIQFWYKNMEYPKEIERGMEAHEDHFSPFALHFDLNKGMDCYIVASTNEYDKIDIFEILKKESERRKSISISQDKGQWSGTRNQKPGFKSQSADPGSHTPLNKLTKLSAHLLSTSDSFIVKREHDKKSIIAGYHWFGDWGRDTMIALPGLALVQGKFKEAKEILLSYAKYVSQGMIPNRFPDYGETPEYNTVDASLWYIHATYQYLRFAKDLKTIQKNLYGVLKEIIECY